MRYEYLILKPPVFVTPNTDMTKQKFGGSLGPKYLSKQVLKGDLKTGFLKFMLCVFYNIKKKKTGI